MTTNHEECPLVPTEALVDRGRFRSRTALVGELVGVFVVGGLTLAIAMAALGTGTVGTIASVWAANVVMLAAVYAGLRARGQRWEHLGLRRGALHLRAILRVVGLSLPVFVVAIVAFAVGAILMANLVGMPDPADMSKYTYLRGNIPLTLLALGSVYCVSAFAEEVIYRGFLITRIRELCGERRLSSWAAVAVSSLLFGLIHSEWGITGMVQASCMGIALGCSYLLVKRNLWVLVLAHAYMDTILVVQMYFS